MARRLLFLFLVFFSLSDLSFCSDLRRLSYTLEPVFSENTMTLQVEMVFRGNSSGQTRIFLPDNWAGQEKLYESIMTVTSPLPDTELCETDKSHIRMVRHEPDAPLKIQYTVKQHWSGPMEGQRFQKYWPIINKRYFHFVGLVFFIFPDRLRTGNVDFEIDWKNFPAEWAICNSFGCGQSHQEITSTMEMFRRAVYAGGDYRIHEILIQDQIVYVTLRGEDWNFSDQEFFNFVGRIVSAERNFWSDHKFPFFLILLTPFGKGHRNSGGTGLHQSFDVFFYADTDLNLGFKRLFAHELFHSWNTAKLGRRESPEQLLYWFSEGFTDFYARLLLLRARLITLEEYVSDFNLKLKNYHLSPVREAPNQKILEGYWSDEDIGLLPYQRGDVIAHRWNALIKTQTEYRQSLDDVMLALFRRAQTGRQVITHALLMEELNPLIGKAVEEEFQKYIDSGQLIELSGLELGPCFELVRVEAIDAHTKKKPVLIPQYRLKPGFSYDQEEACLHWLRNLRICVDF